MFSAKKPLPVIAFTTPLTRVIVINILSITGRGPLWSERSPLQIFYFHDPKWQWICFFCFCEGRRAGRWKELQLEFLGSWTLSVSWNFQKLGISLGCLFYKVGLKVLPSDDPGF